MAQGLDHTSNISARSSLDPSQIVVGSSVFNDIRRSSAFVDKTMLIKDFVTCGDTALVITCPSRFGKSTNMDMIKTFLQIQVDESGNQIKDLEKIENYQIFKQEINNKSLKIMEEHKFVRDHFANHPVIFVNFKDAGDCSKFEDIEKNIKNSIRCAFLEHEYMIEVFRKKINDGDVDEKRKAENYLKQFLRIYEMDGENASSWHIQHSLMFLCEILYFHFGKEVYILIDDYDSSVQNAIWSNEIDVESIIRYFDIILSMIYKDNHYLQKGLMTGVSRLTKPPAHSGFNNASEYEFLCSRRFSKYYGFTEAEVFQLLKDFDITDDHKDKVKSWYGGYKVENVDLFIYNTWSVLKFLQENKYESYWAQSGAINKISKIFKIDGIRKMINKLIENQCVKMELISKFTVNELQKLQNLLNSNGEISSYHVYYFFSFIFELGYLSFSGDKDVYKIPNKEIEIEFKR